MKMKHHLSSRRSTKLKIPVPASPVQGSSNNICKVVTKGYDWLSITCSFVEGDLLVFSQSSNPLMSNLHPVGKIHPKAYFYMAQTARNDFLQKNMSNQLYGTRVLSLN